MKITVSFCLMAIAVLAIAMPVGLLRGAASEPGNGEGTIDPARDAYRQSYRLEKEAQYEDAIAAMQNAPKGYNLELRLGWLYYLARDYSTADTHYRAAMKDDSSAIEAKIGFLLPLLAEKRYAEVEATARQVLQVDPNNYYANLRMSYALRWQLKFQQADAVAARMSGLYPSDTSFMAELALAKMGEKQQSAAKKIFNNILLLDPDNALAKEEMNYLKGF